MHCPHAHAEADVLAVAEATFDAPPLGVEVDQFPRGPVGGAGGQAPGLLHAFGLHTTLPTGWPTAVTAAPRSTRARPPAPTHSAAARASPSAAVTVMLPRKRMTKSNFNSSVSTRYSLRSPKPRSATRQTWTPSGSASAKRTRTWYS